MKRILAAGWLILLAFACPSIASADVAVTISPTTVHVQPAGSAQFTAHVTGTTNPVVIWSLSGLGCTGIACGHISSGGLYTAPAVTPNPNVVTVTATSLADLSKNASAAAIIGNNSDITVSVSPATISLVTGTHQLFTAVVTGTTITGVTWSVSGSGCSGAACGTVTTTGIYTAPATVPAPPQVTVTATSVADPTKFGTASVTILPPVVVTISPTSAHVEAGEQQQFTATVTGTTNHAVTWSVSGTGCSGAACGTVTTSGLYTAPNVIPNPAQVTVTATSVADPTKSASAIVTVIPLIVVTVAPTTAQVEAGSQQQFIATVVGTPNTAVTWSVSGTGCAGSTCGTVTVNGLYTAPNVVPNPPQVTVKATSVADPTKSASAIVTILPPVIVTISPTTAQVVAGAQQQFTATVTGTTNHAVTWSVSGSGCTGPACGTVTTVGLYTAPATVPNPPQVTVTATSVADQTKSASAVVTILPPVAVTISPTTAQVLIGGQQQFTATVTGTTNHAVTWTVTGAGCNGAACGTITTSGLYTAPASVPNPPQVTVTATSVADPTKSASAIVTILSSIVVTISPTTAQVVTGGQQQFTATVGGTTNQAVTWSVSGSGCTGTACGTVTTSGLYTAPTTIPSPPQVAVTATSVVDTTKFANAIVTIIPPVVVTISPTTAQVVTTGRQQFTATVTGTNNRTVTWSVSGRGCSGAACGTVTNGLYTAPASIPSPPQVTVTATSVADPSKSASAIVTIVANYNSKLNGQYAFLFTGFDGNGVYQAAGSLTSDGNGTITHGLEDVNNTTRPSTSVPFTGTYTVGGDDRGILTISSALGTQTFRFALNQAGTKGRLIAFDNSGIRGSGILEQQDATAFTTAAFRGSYVLSLTGQDSAGARIGALGLMLLNGSGGVSTGILDANDGGIVSPTFALNGNYRVSSTGRGTLSLAIPNFAGGFFSFAFYVVSSSEVLMVSTDQFSLNNPIFSGPVEQQTGAPFQTSSFRGATIFSLSGALGSTAQVMVGNISFDGASRVAADFDQNAGGSITIGTELTGAYSVQINGRGTLNLDDSHGLSYVWLIYAIAPNRALLMDASTAYVGMGELKPQTTRPPFNNGDIAGSYLLGSGGPLLSTAPLYSGAEAFDGRQAVSGEEDTSTSGALLPDQTVVGTYNISGTANDGRGTLLLTAPNAATIAVWVTSSTEVLGLGIDPTNSQPVVLHFEQ
jgi:hypothetical protein